MNKKITICSLLLTLIFASPLFANINEKTNKAIRPDVQGNAPIVGCSTESKLDFSKIFAALKKLKCQHEIICEKLENLEQDIIDDLITTSIDFAQTCSILIETQETLSLHNQDVMQRFNQTCTKLINLEENLEEHIATVSLNTQITCSKIIDLSETLSIQNMLYEEQLYTTCTKLLSTNDTLDELIVTVSFNSALTCSKIEDISQTLSNHNAFVMQQFDITCSKLEEITDTINSISSDSALTISKINETIQTLSIHNSFVIEQFENSCTKIQQFNSSLYELEETVSLNTQLTCSKIIEILETLSAHNEFVNEQFDITCSKLIDLNDDINDGFNNTTEKINDIEQALCEKIQNIKIQANLDTTCDILITQSLIDEGFITPIANTVYCLAESVTFASDCAILINKDNVVLNLQGHTIQGNSPGSSAIKVQGVLNTTVKNGIISNPNGAAMNGSFGIVVENSTMVKIADILLHETYASGIKCENSRELFIDRVCTFSINAQNNTLPVNDQAAISLNNSCRNFTIQDCAIYQSGNAGLKIINSSQGSLLHNKVQNALVGFDLDTNFGLSCHSCIAQQLTATGFNVIDTDDTEFIHCISQEAGTDGFALAESGNVLLKKCTAQECGLNGFSVTTGSAIEFDNCTAINTNFSAGMHAFIIGNGNSANCRSIGLNKCSGQNFEYGINIQGVDIISIEHSSLQSCIRFIETTATSSNILIKKCNLAGSAPGLPSGILIDQNSSNIIIAKNNILNVGINGIGLLSGTNLLVIQNNIQGNLFGIFNNIALTEAKIFANFASNNSTANYGGAIPAPTGAPNCFWLNES